MLASHDVELVFESDGASAIDRIRAVRPGPGADGRVLPGRDGVDHRAGLEGDPELASIPVVMLTGEARREILVRSMEAGAADFIVKPFTPDALVPKLSRFLPAIACAERPPRGRPALSADVTGMPRNCPATAGPAGRG